MACLSLFGLENVAEDLFVVLCVIAERSVQLNQDTSRS